MREVLRRERDGRRREVDARDARAVARETDEIGAGAASDLEHPAAAVLIERHQPRQMVQLFEMVLLEIGKKSGRARRMRRDVEVVNVCIPVRANGAL